MSSLIFIDPRVQDYERLITGLPPETQFVILDPALDGIARIAAALAGAADLDAIHIISHGSSGTLYLGSTVVSEDTLDDYESELARIGAALSEAGDLLLYGCEVGSGATGQRFIDALARFTGADIAASTDLTGSAALGGDWLLEASAGTVATAPLVNGQTGFDGLLAAPAVTPGGAPDTTFDTDGKVTTAFSATNTPDWGYAVDIQDNGKIVVAGEHDGTVAGFGVARYNSHGGLDTTFGGDGTVATAVASQARAFGVAVQSNGKIVLAGHADTDPTATADQDFAVVRYNTNGSLDTTFSGDGKVTTAIGTAHDAASSMVIQSNGKIVLAGNSDETVALVRCNTNGSLDSTFGGDGKVTTDLGPASEVVAWAVAVQSDGKIVVAGSISEGSDNDFVVVRYTTSGNLDSTFSGDGKAITDFGTTSDAAYSVAIQSDGRIVVAGNSGAEFAVARYNTDGSPDTNFSGDGKVASDIATGSAQGGVAIQSDGRIVVAGHYSGPDLDFILLRYNADGSLDTTFDGDGRMEFPSIGADYANGLAIQPDGAIVMSGASSQFFTGMDFAVVRVMPGGIPDQTAPVDDLYRYTFPPNLFTDPEGDPLTYSANLADGSALPSWLSFNSATRTFSGTPGLGDQGSFSIRVTASDGTLSSSDVYVLKVGLFGTAAANTLTGSNFDDFVDGLSGNDTLSGGAGNDTLDGGAGVDVMRGGSGSDLYLVDRATDRVVETSNVAALPDGGAAALAGIIDTVNALVSYNLSGVAFVENIALTGNAARATGNELNNLVTGNGRGNVLQGLAGADTLNGGRGNDRLDGGDGSDRLAGGAGRDTYTVGAGDVVIELTGQGRDLVNTSVTHVLKANVENLTLMGSAGIGGTGNAGANTITGNDAANKLTGNLGGDTLLGRGGADVLRGGAGRDTLTGGSGADKFDFDAITNVDRITDFSVVNDTMRLDNDVFTAFGAVNMTLAAGAFRKGAGVIAAQDSSDRIVYNTTNGNLYYDEDGADGTGAVLFATLAGSPAITNADFFIIA